MMSAYLVWWIAAVLTYSFCKDQVSARTADNKPNIIIFLMDDVRLF